MCRIVLMFVPLLIVSTTLAQDSASTINPSSELNANQAAKIKPPPPSGVTVQVKDKRILVDWQTSGLTTVVSYNVYRKVGTGVFEQIGSTSAPPFTDSKAPAGQAFYTVTAVSYRSGESRFSESTAKPRSSEHCKMNSSKQSDALDN